MQGSIVTREGINFRGIIFRTFRFRGSSSMDLCFRKMEKSASREVGEGGLVSQRVAAIRKRMRKVFAILTIEPMMILSGKKVKICVKLLPCNSLP